MFDLHIFSGALKLISPTRVAIPRSVNILVSFLLESADEPFQPIEILGGICIFATIAFAAQEKNLIEKCPLLGKSLLNCDKDSCSANTENPLENPEAIEERRAKLEAWMNGLITKAKMSALNDPASSSLPLIHDFLEIDAYVAKSMLIERAEDEDALEMVKKAKEAP